ncbi:hypothetical protein ACFL49_01925 [Candidatus Omnitrophota bacterium]
MFSNDARWDRDLPSDNKEEDAIEVGTLFRGGRIIPCMFVWQERRYKIKEVTCFWKEKKGSEALYNFSVTDGINLFQIVLNAHFMVWRLAKVLPLGES